MTEPLDGFERDCDGVDAGRIVKSVIIASAGAKPSVTLAWSGIASPSAILARTLMSLTRG
jgi:hypothetical protein